MKSQSNLFATMLLELPTPLLWNRSGEFFNYVSLILDKNITDKKIES